MSHYFDSLNRDLLHSGHHQRKKREELNARDKLQPTLLDRLTDNEPHKRVESVQNSLVSHTTLRRSVLRDLQWLLNCINNEAQHDLSLFPQVQRSVFNFGIAPLAGKRMSDIEWQDMQSKLTEAILNFEPRILPDDLEVRCLSTIKSLDLHNVISIEIKGRLWCVPWPLAFLYQTDLDLENGNFELKDMS
ncbi:type VI secretion system baseplate subunit TssE [Kalamiella sp. sgz302252]|uniref:type VI secretion system baseplate subunit TssE n=1 Tax=Pantoea sp. sgz302252 TaxID=3341827 RepID=UPI0036D42D9B